MRPGPRHRRTWREFLDRLSPIGRDRLPYTYIADMAETLSIAAPDGPRGFECRDECQCGVIV